MQTSSVHHNTNGSSADQKGSGNRASFVRHMVRDSVAKLINRLIDQGKGGNLLGPVGSTRVDRNNLPSRPDEKSSPFPENFKVCIVGAGIAGLYSALILDHLNISYDILEAAPRPGGRILTHYFSTKKHDYYDIGAMRFPNVLPMERYILFPPLSAAMLTGLGLSIFSRGLE